MNEYSAELGVATLGAIELGGTELQRNAALLANFSNAPREADFANSPKEQVFA